MITLDFEQRPEYPEWAAQNLKIDREYFGNCSTISVWSDESLCAVIVYSAYNSHNCEVTVSAVNKWWLRREVMDVLMNYPFNQLGCRRITLLIRDGNRLVSRLVEKLGFIQEGRLREFYPDGNDCLVYGLLKTERRH